MKRILSLILLAALPAYAAMSDSTALRQAKTLWGNLGAIGTIRDQTATNWTKQVGVKSIGCLQPFTVLGSGFNTWDNAYADAAAHPVSIAGPLKGTVNFLSNAWDNVAVTKFDFIIDGVPLNAVITLPPQQDWDVSVPVNTSLLSNALHVVCVRAEDAAGNVGLSAARLFYVDQAVAQATPEFRLNPQLPPDGRPSVRIPELLQSGMRFIRWNG